MTTSAAKAFEKLLCDRLALRCDDGADTENDTILDSVLNEIATRKTSIADISEINFLLEADLRSLKERFKLLTQSRSTPAGGLTFARKLEERADVSQFEPCQDHFGKEKVELYGRLLFLLQFEQDYFVHLVNQSSLAKIDALLDIIIFKVYGNQLNAHEEHCLLAFLSRILVAQFETSTELTASLRSNTAASRTLGAYFHRGPAQAYLQNVLGPVVRDIIDLDASLEISPLSIFNELRSTSPHDASFDQPFDTLNAEQHPKYPALQEIAESRYQLLSNYVNRLFDAVFASLDHLPYGVRWIAKLLQILAQHRFPNTETTQIFSLLSGYFFLRYLNPAVVAPQNYFLVTFEPTDMAKRNLTMLARFVQMAANSASSQKKVFTINTKPLMSSIEPRMRSFLKSLPDVPDFYETQEIDHFLSLTTRKLKLRFQMKDIAELRKLLKINPPSSAEMKTILKKIEKCPPTSGLSLKAYIEIPLVTDYCKNACCWNLLINQEQPASKFLAARSACIKLRRAFPQVTSLQLILDLEPDCHFKDAWLVASDFIRSAKETPSCESLELLSELVEAEFARLGDLRSQAEADNLQLRRAFEAAQKRQASLLNQIHKQETRLQQERVFKPASLGQFIGRKINYTPREFFESGILKSWTFADSFADHLVFKIRTMQNFRFELSLSSRRRPDKLVSLVFKLDTLLDLMVEEEILDLRFCRLSISPLISVLRTLS